jgi:hypothetical protein
MRSGACRWNRQVHEGMGDEDFDVAVIGDRRTVNLDFTLVKIEG